MQSTQITYDVPCIRCGYNVRGLSYDHLCPECGKPIETTVSAYVSDAVDSAATTFRLNLFDRICALLAAILGLLLLLIGGFGLFFGAQASFTLPPILGALPALVGWGIVRSVICAFRANRSQRPHRSHKDSLSIYRDPVPRTAADLDAEIDRRSSLPPSS